VCGIVELLENILLHADMETLFNAQHVNKSCFDIIARSSVLQKRMYLMPVCSYAEAAELGIVRKDCKIWGDKRGSSIGKYNKGGELKQAVVNPMVLSAVERCSGTGNFLTLSDVVLRGLQTNKPRQESSWTSMLLTQPPHFYYGEVHLDAKPSPQNPGGAAAGIVYNVYAAGQTIGETMDLVDKRQGPIDWANAMLRFAFG
jgi:hypothetical protein